MADKPNPLGIDSDKLARLKQKLAEKSSQQLEDIAQIPLQPLGSLEKQVLEKDGSKMEAFGAISPEEASKFARISDITKSEIIIVGSASADQTRLSQVRFASNDVIATPNGETRSRPVGDYDVVINPQTKDGFKLTSAYVEQNIVIPKQSINPDFKADYIYLNEKYDRTKPFTVFRDGSVVDHSPGSDIYYSPEGGGVKIKP